MKTRPWLIALALLASLPACGEMQSDGAYGNMNYGPTLAPPPPLEPGDKYEPVGTNPFVSASHDPLSTFAADVDTASYQIFKRDVAMNTLPQADSVRLEEWVNYFKYDYPAPAPRAEIPFEITLEASPTPFAGEHLLLGIGIKATAPEAFVKKPTNLVFLIDTSGSMTSEDKLPLVKKVLTETLEVLDPSDTVAIVTYAGSTRVHLQATPVSSKQLIATSINGLSSGGSTNGAGGINLAYQQAESAFIEGGINHVLLCTDGDFNVGVSGDTDLVSLIEQKRETGITLTVLGFGYGNLNDSMMEKITNAGNGVYGVISDEDEAINYVHERMLSTLSFVAKDMKVQVEFNAERVLAYRLLGYENRALADDQFRDDTVDAGEVGAGHAVTALYEVVLAGGVVPEAEGAPALDDGAAYDGPVSVGAEELVRVMVRYKNVDASATDPAFEVAEGLTFEDVSARVQSASANLQWAVAVAAFAEILKGSPYGERANLAEIEALIGANAGSDANRLEFVNLFGIAKGLL